MSEKFEKKNGGLPFDFKFTSLSSCFEKNNRIFSKKFSQKNWKRGKKMLLTAASTGLSIGNIIELINYFWNT